MTPSTTRRLTRSVSALLGATLLSAGGAEAQSVTWRAADPTVIYTGSTTDVRVDPRLALNNAQVCGHDRTGTLRVTWCNNATGGRSVTLARLVAATWTSSTVASGALAYDSPALAFASGNRDRVAHGWIEQSSDGSRAWKVQIRVSEDGGIIWSPPSELTSRGRRLANLSIATWMHQQHQWIGACWDVPGATPAENRAECTVLRESHMLSGSPPTPVTLSGCTENPSIAGFGSTVLVACDDYESGRPTNLYTLTGTTGPMGGPSAYTTLEVLTGNDGGLAFDDAGTATLGFQAPSGGIGRMTVRRLPPGATSWQIPWTSGTGTLSTDGVVGVGWFAHVAAGMPAGQILMSWEWTRDDFQSSNKYFGLLYENDASTESVVVFNDADQGGTTTGVTYQSIAPSICSNGSTVDRFWVNSATAQLFHQRGTLSP